MSISRTLMVLGSILLSGFIVLGQPQSNLAFTLSLEQSNPGKFHVEFYCEGIKDEIQDFKMPAISPGYYRVLDFAANVENFNAEDGSGKPLPWEKIAKNTWRVGTDRIGLVRISYDVKSNRSSVASSFIDEKRAYISTPSVFIYPDGQINHAVTVTLVLPSNFPKISTGLDLLQDKANTFYAQNFDVLYDCPIYLGNQEIISFDVQGIWHNVSLENPGTFDRQQFMANLKKMIEAATAIVGDIPYRHYTFIFMGEGLGGLEHQNSSALFINVSGEQNPWLKKDLMKFLTHEYFHLYNVKSIRPIALGPFSYDGENNTDMLWFSEGGTVYYEYIILNRAGFLSRKECLESFSSIIARNENNPAHLSQSVAEASHNAWTQSFFGSENELSYYDKGLALSLLLDLKIRHETKNKKSLDNIMSTCYYEFYKKKQRGFTNQEFRQVCENTAGISLADFFAYIYNTAEIDYGKYFAYAGLAVEKIRDDQTGYTFLIKRLPNPTPLQCEIFQGWLKE
jgi:predicted metalloprotease with PDZ domain